MYKSIMITGGCGFIGSNFINYIFYKIPECLIINVDAMYYCASENNILNSIRTDARYHLIKANTSDYELMSNLLIKYEIDCVVNFAAQSHVQNSFTDSLLYTRDNIMGTHTLLEACRIYKKLKLFVHVSTDEVYGESDLCPNAICKNEQSILCPTNPYAATKAGAELIVQSYYYSFKMPIIITRGNNVYGPLQYPEKLIPLFIQLLNSNQKVTIQGNGSNIRAFLYVNDVCAAFYHIILKGVIGEIYNIGCDEKNQEYSVLEVAHILIEKIKKTRDFDQWIKYVEDRAFNDKRYYISNKKIKELGWQIEHTFDQGINETINYWDSINKNKINLINV